MKTKIARSTKPRKTATKAPRRATKTAGVTRRRPSAIVKAPPAMELVTDETERAAAEEIRRWRPVSGRIRTAENSIHTAAMDLGRLLWVVECIATTGVNVGSVEREACRTLVSLSHAARDLTDAQRSAHGVDVAARAAGKAEG